MEMMAEFLKICRCCFSTSEKIFHDNYAQFFVFKPTWHSKTVEKINRINL